MEAGGKGLECLPAIPSCATPAGFQPVPQFLHL